MFSVVLKACELWEIKERERGTFSAISVLHSLNSSSGADIHINHDVPVYLDSRASRTEQSTPRSSLIALIKTEDTCHLTPLLFFFPECRMESDVCVAD